MTTAPIPYTPPGHYLFFSVDTTEEQARAVFVKRYGIEPENVFRLYGAGREVWAGPVPITEGNDGQRTD